jgi:hypothetical protein
MTAAQQNYRIGEFFFRLYDRQLHPELFEVISSRAVNRGPCEISIRVTPYGHVLEWRLGKIIVVELTASPKQMLPQRGLLISHGFEANHSGNCQLSSSHRYRVLSQVERLNNEEFQIVHDEMIVDGNKRGLFVYRTEATRSRLPALSWIDVTPLVGGLAVSAIHTFPEERAIAKTQSLIEPAN